MEFIKPAAKTPAPGREVDAYCARCKLELTHVIIALEGGRIAKVQCRTCNSIHAFRGQPPPPRAGARGSTRPSVGKGLTASEFDRLIAGRDLSRAKPYRVETRFAAGDVINHPQFGLGVATRVLSDRKIEVGFPVGLKVLVHDRA
jgi:hypothetical protein